MLVKVILHVERLLLLLVDDLGNGRHDGFWRRVENFVKQITAIRIFPLGYVFD